MNFIYPDYEKLISIVILSFSVNLQPYVKWKITTIFFLSYWGSLWWYDHPVEPIKYAPFPLWFILLKPAFLTTWGKHTPIKIVVSGKKKAVCASFTISKVYLAWFVTLELRITTGPLEALLE
jgi:hypothetical protein